MFKNQIKLSGGLYVFSDTVNSKYKQKFLEEKDDFEKIKYLKGESPCVFSGTVKTRNFNEKKINAPALGGFVVSRRLDKFTNYQNVDSAYEEAENIHKEIFKLFNNSSMH